MILLRVLPVRIKRGSEFQTLLYVPVIGYIGPGRYLYHGIVQQTFILRIFGHLFIDGFRQRFVSKAPCQKQWFIWCCCAQANHDEEACTTTDAADAGADAAKQGGRGSHPCPADIHSQVHIINHAYGSTTKSVLTYSWRPETVFLNM